MRILILCLFLVACTVPQKAAPAAPAPAAPNEVTMANAHAREMKARVARDSSAAPPPHNTICERFAELNPEAVCTPELTDAPPNHTHKARIKLGTQLIACLTNVTTPSIVCSDPIVVQMQPQPKAEEPPAQAEKPTPRARRRKR